jgi:mRNA interferase MazF
MTRGEIRAAAGGPDYAGKPRPVVILQDDAFDATQSVTICPFTTSSADAPLVRLDLEPSTENGLRASSRLMVDTITAVARRTLHTRVGRLSDAETLRLNRAVIVFLGLAGPPSR